MSTESPQYGLHSFYEYLGRRLESGRQEISPEESVKEYRAYLDELERFRQRVQTSVDQADRGEAKPLDHDALMQRVSERLAKEGITD